MRLYATGPSRKAVLLAVCLTALSSAACTSIIGSFTEGTTDGGPTKEAGGETDAKHEDAPEDAPPPTDSSGDSTKPSVAANTGSALTAGGGYSTSANYKLVGAVGQSPGGNMSSGSASFKLQGGVIGATQ
jgi:hypothetical protein